MVRSGRCCEKHEILSGRMNATNIAFDTINRALGQRCGTGADTENSFPVLNKSGAVGRSDPIREAYLRRHRRSENKFQSKLNGATAARADDGIGGGDVRG